MKQKQKLFLVSEQITCLQYRKGLLQVTNYALATGSLAGDQNG